jgi:hypothetical protein
VLAVNKLGLDFICYIEQEGGNGVVSITLTRSLISLPSNDGYPGLSLY